MQNSRSSQAQCPGKTACLALVWHRFTPAPRVACQAHLQEPLPEPDNSGSSSTWLGWKPLQMTFESRMTITSLWLSTADHGKTDHPKFALALNKDGTPSSRCAAKGQGVQNLPCKIPSFLEAAAQLEPEPKQKEVLEEAPKPSTSVLSEEDRPKGCKSTYCRVYIISHYKHNSNTVVAALNAAACPS